MKNKQSKHIEPGKKKIYPNPTIIEAVIEIYLDKPLEAEDNEKIEKALGTEYPLDKDELAVYTASFNPSGMSLLQDKSSQMRLKFNIGEGIFVQVYQGRFSFHWVGNYPGWEIFKAKFEKFWKQFFKAVPSIMVQQVGVRYINKLDQKTVDQKVGFWLKPSPNYPKNILDALCDFFYKSKWPLLPDRWAEICIAEVGIVEHTRPLMLDIDVIQQVKKPIKFESVLSDLIDELHSKVYEIFESSLSSNYKKLLNFKYKPK